MSESEEIETMYIPNQPCVDQENCGSSDAMAIYIPKGAKVNAHCFSCETHFFEKDLADLDIDSEAGIERLIKATKAVQKSTGKPISQEQIDTIKMRSTLKGKMFRDIDDETLSFYKIRTEFHPETGEPFKRYYPNTLDGKPCSYQVRVVTPKKMFFFIGHASSKMDFFGQNRFPDGGNKLLIVGGQEDCAAASQMLWNYSKRRNQTQYGRTAVVSTPSGENCVKVIKNQYKWLDSFDEIIFGLDNDEAGQKAMEDALPYFPKGKVKVASWAGKDPNAMLQSGNQDQFISNFFKAKKEIPVGIVGSG